MMGERADLPTGIVTLVLTDIEGSTRLAAALGDAYGAALSHHRRIIRKAFRDRGGAEVDTQGDAFLYAFVSPCDALEAAAAAQRGLAAHGWPGGNALRVRIGVHTGAPTRTDEGYVGLDLHVAARVMGAAHGGQVVVSDAAAAGLRAEDVSGLSLRDLGEHRLKDIARPARLYQLVGDGLHAEFPPPRSVSGRFSNLPAAGSPLVGRAREIAAIDALLGEGRRLLTLTGPGGTGKTRLALAAAEAALDRFPGGVAFCDLSHVLDPELVASTIAAALGVRDSGGRSAEEALGDVLAERALLLVLDNFEHVLDAAPLVARLLAACPGLSILCTSRAPLELRAETEWQVPPLGAGDAVALLSDRAERIDRAPPDAGVAEAICARLDGLPLAIELAAARLRAMPAEVLLARLDRRLTVLTGGARDAPARQRTLRATLEWSHELLGETERSAFARCACFAGSFTLEGAEAVCLSDADAIEALVAHSLLRREGDRLSMLETIRDYASERLAASGEESATRERHAAKTAERVERLGLGFYRGDQSGQLAEADAELDDVRAALGWMLDGDRPERALPLATSLWVLWETRHRAEGVPWLLRALRAAPEADEASRASGLLAAGHLAYFQGDLDQARPLLEEAEKLFGRLGDEQGRARAIGRLAWVAGDSGEREREGELLALARSLLPAIQDPAIRGDALRFVGGSLWSQGSLAAAGRAFEEERGIWAVLGNRQKTANCLNNLGWLAVTEGRLADAERLLDESLALAYDAEDRFSVMLALGSRSVVALLSDDRLGATGLASENLVLCREDGDRRLVPESLVVAAALAAAEHPVPALTLVGAAESLGALEPVHREIVATRIVPASEAAGFEGASADELRAAGGRLSLAEAVDAALVLLDPIRRRA
jgi:predicted ATPase/class 3 adenylate cyclase